MEAMVNNERKDTSPMDETAIRSIDELGSSKIPSLKRRYRELFG